jgi:hypothetical protein
MTKQEIKDQIQVDVFGLLKFGKTSALKQLHGKTKYVDNDGTILFKDANRKLYLLPCEEVQSFEPKEMTPEIKEYKGLKVLWEGGRLFYADNGKDVEIK